MWLKVGCVLGPTLVPHDTSMGNAYSSQVVMQFLQPPVLVLVVRALSTWYKAQAHKALASGGIKGGGGIRWWEQCEDRIWERRCRVWRIVPHWRHAPPDQRYITWRCEQGGRPVKLPRGGWYPYRCWWCAKRAHFARIERRRLRRIRRRKAYGFRYLKGRRRVKEKEDASFWDNSDKDSNSCSNDTSNSDNSDDKYWYG